MDAPERPPRRIALVGLRGSGKSSVGVLLAERLGIPFSDSDQTLTDRVASPAELIRDRGLDAFRALEAKVVVELSRAPEGVLALGGGAVESADVRAALATWWVVHLDAPDEHLLARINSDNADRPAITDLSPAAEIAHLRDRRAPLYSSVAAVMITTGEREPSEVVAAIVERLAEGYASQ